MPNDRARTNIIFEASEAVPPLPQWRTNFAAYFRAAMNPSLRCDSTFSFDEDAPEGDLFSLLFEALDVVID